MPFRASAPLTDDWANFRFEVADGIATITLDRPERLNALTFDVYADLRDLFTSRPDFSPYTSVPFTSIWAIGTPARSDSNSEATSC